MKGARHEPNNSCCPGITRRSFLADTGMGFTGLALGAMLFRDGVARAQESSLAKKLSAKSASDDQFARAAFEQILSRRAKPEELKACREFLAKHASAEHARENLVTVLFNHNDFVTVR